MSSFCLAPLGGGAKEVCDTSADGGQIRAAPPPRFRREGEEAADPIGLQFDRVTGPISPEGLSGASAR